MVRRTTVKMASLHLGENPFLALETCMDQLRKA